MCFNKYFFYVRFLAFSCSNDLKVKLKDAFLHFTAVFLYWKTSMTSVNQQPVFELTTDSKMQQNLHSRANEAISALCVPSNTLYIILLSLCLSPALWKIHFPGLIAVLPTMEEL